MQTDTPKSAAGIAWNLNALFASPADPAIPRTLAALDARADAFATAYRGTIAPGPDAAVLLKALQEYEALNAMAARVGAYGSLVYSADTTRDENRALVQRNEEALTALQNKLLFFNLEWQAVPEARALALMADPQLANYTHHLHHARRYTPHTLSEPEERLNNNKDLTGINAWTRLFTEHTSSQTFEIDINGEKRALNQSEILTLMRQPDRDVRRRAHEALYGTLTRNAQVSTFIFDTRFQDHLVQNRLRGFDSPAAPRHLDNDVDAGAVEAMMRAVEANFGLAQRYFRVKAKLLGLEALELYDQYAPVLDVKEHISYTDAGTRVINAMERFSPEFAHLTQRFFEESWIDADPRPGKRGGAFCAGIVPDLNPYILMNYTDDMRDVMTLAHELGHGLHDLLAGGQTLLNYYPSLPVAETASVFAEMLVFEDLLASLPNDKARLALLAGKIEDSFATVFRQTVLTRFESLAYAERARGRITTKRMGELWLQANAPYYGDAVRMTPGYEMGWSYIPHFIHTPFYCYAYAFGQLLVLALYGDYRRDGAASFVPKFRAMLAAGGSSSPRELAAMMGLDIHDPAFWQVGFDELGRLVDEAERLAHVGS